tara:strand:- start:4183 stop:4368 length:186 start_codon:yes stop_codon:yes gene_type:complete
VSTGKKVRPHKDDIGVKILRNSRRKGGVPALVGYCEKSDTLMYKFISPDDKDKLTKKYGKY